MTSTLSKTRKPKAGKMSWAARFGLAVIALYLFIVLFCSWIAPYGQTAIVGMSMDPWSAEHWLGTDELGRDLLSRLLYAIRNTAVLAFTANALAFIVGVSLGLSAAFKGGWIDNVLSRLVDSVLALPQLILALLMLSIFGNSTGVLIAVIASLDSMRVYRLARAAGMNIVVLPFVEASRLRGESMIWCILHEILPNVATPLLAELGIRFCYVFLFISGLSFLGLGLQPPAADLGSMVKETSGLISFGDFTPLIPAAAIALITVSVNLVIDWILHKNSGLE
ncbi:MAG: ABC transporter permease [Pseudomonadota bacterium]